MRELIISQSTDKSASTKGHTDSLALLLSICQWHVINGHRVQRCVLSSFSQPLPSKGRARPIADHRRTGSAGRALMDSVPIRLWVSAFRGVSLTSWNRLWITLCPISNRCSIVTHRTKGSPGPRGVARELTWRALERMQRLLHRVLKAGVGLVLFPVLLAILPRVHLHLGDVVHRACCPTLYYGD